MGFVVEVAEVAPESVPLDVRARRWDRRGHVTFGVGLATTLVAFPVAAAGAATFFDFEHRRESVALLAVGGTMVFTGPVVLSVGALAVRRSLTLRGIRGAPALGYAGLGVGTLGLGLYLADVANFSRGVTAVAAVCPLLSLGLGVGQEARNARVALKSLPVTVGLAPMIGEDRTGLALSGTW